jgi:ADP-ribose pyrophosphatase
MARVPPPKVVKKLVRKSSAPVADHGVFRVDRLGYETIGRDIFVFNVPDWCNVVAETPEGELVLIWQYRFGTDSVCLEIPGGVVDPGESPESTARRELREETGYDAESFELVQVVEPNPALQNNKCWTFLARGARLAHPTEWDDIEELEVVLAKKEHLAEMIDDGTITHALVITAVENYLRRFAMLRR